MARPSGHGTGFETRRQETIDTAATLFARRGYAGTGIAEIGETVGLGKGALYYYIGPKENLLVEIQGRALRPLLRSARRIDKLDEAPVLKLRLLSESLLEMILRRLDHIRVYEHDYRYPQGENLSRLLRQRREFEAIVRGLLKSGMETGALGQMNSQLAVLQFLNLHNQYLPVGSPEQDMGRGAPLAGVLRHVDRRTRPQRRQPVQRRGASARIPYALRRHDSHGSRQQRLTRVPRACPRSPTEPGPRHRVRRHHPHLLGGRGRRPGSPT